MQLIEQNPQRLEPQNPSVHPAPPKSAREIFSICEKKSFHPYCIGIRDNYTTARSVSAGIAD
jgi:hypothetical protein